MQAILLAGGKGTRLRPFTHVFPKPLMPLGDADPMPIIEVVLRQLARFGFRDVTVITGYLTELIEAFCGDGRQVRHPADAISREVTPLGTAGGLTLVDRPAEPVLVINGDILTTLDFAAMFAFHSDREAAATIASYPREVTHRLRRARIRRRSARPDRLSREARVLVPGEHGRVHPRPVAWDYLVARPALADARLARDDAGQAGTRSTVSGRTATGSTSAATTTTPPPTRSSSRAGRRSWARPKRRSLKGRTEHRQASRLRGSSRRHA